MAVSYTHLDVYKRQRELRLNYRDYFRGGMGAEAVRDLLGDVDLEATAEEPVSYTHLGREEGRGRGDEGEV